MKSEQGQLCVDSTQSALFQSEQILSRITILDAAVSVKLTSCYKTGYDHQTFKLVTSWFDPRVEEW